MMLNRLILKVTKFQLPPPKRLGTVVKNILGGHHAPPCQIGLKVFDHAIKTLEDRVEFQVDDFYTPCHRLLEGLLFFLFQGL